MVVTGVGVHELRIHGDVARARGNAAVVVRGVIPDIVAAQIGDGHGVAEDAAAAAAARVLTEYVVLDGQLQFFLVMPSHLKSRFSKQITAFYPDVFVEQVEDYNIFRSGYHSAYTRKIRLFEIQ